MVKLGEKIKINEKATPKKVKKEFKNGIFSYRCPVCNYLLIMSSYETDVICGNYCSKCGEKLEWRLNE